jgi:hypothetical protein
LGRTDGHSSTEDFSIVISLVTVQGLLCWMFKTGPFAWDGFFAGAIPPCTFLPWCILMAVMLVRAIDKEGAASGALVGAR